MTRVIALLVLISVGLAGATYCARFSTAAPAAVDEAPVAHPSRLGGTLPPRLAQIGLFVDLGNLTPAADVQAYDVRHPLWSDGTVKVRHVWLPAGTAIEVGPEGEFHFPDGTVGAKTFSSPADLPGRIHRRLETRVLRKEHGRWEHATYVWNQAGDDALRTDGEDTPLDVVLPGCEQPYVVPGRISCLQCHAGSSDTMIGVAGYQLTDASFDALAAAGRLPRAVPHRTIAGATPLERDALGYLAGNCAHCHNPAASSFEEGGLDLRPHAAKDSLIDVEPSRLVTPGAAVRVAPGDPRASVLYRLFTRTYTEAASSDRNMQMPPLGNQLVDPDGAELLAAWIADVQQEAPSRELAIVPTSPRKHP